MKARRTHFTTKVYRLPGGTEDNDLWTYEVPDTNGNKVVASVWEPTPEERRRIMEGENIRLLIWGTMVPPVALDLTDEPLGMKPVTL